jgi:hypothetical protein
VFDWENKPTVIIDIWEIEDRATICFRFEVLIAVNIAQYALKMHETWIYGLKYKKLPKIGRKNLRIPKPPNLRISPAKIIDPAVDASAWASGNQL